MKRTLVSLSLLLFLLLGCLSQSNPPNIAGGDFPITVYNNRGENISFEQYPERIVSLAPSNTEILFSLGLGEKIVGVTEYCDYPEEAKEKEQIGGFSTVNVEKVLTLEPDLILATGGVQFEIVEKLRDLGLKVVVIDAKNIDEILENIILVGRITGSDDSAELLVTQLKSRIEAVEQEVTGAKTTRVAYILWGDPLMVAGKDTFIGDLIILAGGENVFSDAAVQYPKISMESMIDRNPEVLINGDHSGIELKDLRSRPEWREISAVKDNHLYTIDADMVSRQGPRIVDALELFSEWIGGVGPAK